jgi:UDP-glucose 4-epimerase
MALNACSRHPVSCHRVNVGGTLNVLEAARRAGAKVVFSSASAVYGETRTTSDESQPLAPSSLYGASKIAGESYVRAYGVEYGLST